MSQYVPEATRPELEKVADQARGDFLSVSSEVYDLRVKLEALQEQVSFIAASVVSLKAKQEILAAE